MPTIRYSDLDLTFMSHPIKKDVTIKLNEEAVKRSIMNLVETNFYERPFHPEIGSGIHSLLFENFNYLTQNLLKEKIQELVLNNEPRANLKEVVVNSNVDENSFDVSITFTLINSDKPVTINLSLERLR